MTNGARASENKGSERSSSGSAGRVRRTALVVAGLVAVTVAGGLVPFAGAGLSERSMAESWHRAVDADPNIVPAFDRSTPGQASLHPASSADPAKPLIVGDQVTLVTPDGAIHTLRVCDPASPHAASAPDCLNAFANRAIVPPVAPVPQRSL